MKRYSYKGRTSYRPRGALSASKYRRKSYRTLQNNDAVKQLAVCKYAHSTATTNPKIPDGAESTSIGMRLHHFVPITYAAGATKLQISLQPNITCPLSYAQYTNLGVLVPASFNLYTPPFGRTPTNGAGTGIGTEWGQWNIGEIGKWRIVSLGLRIRNTNNDTQDNGSWTACRLPVLKNCTKYALSVDGGGNLLGIFPEPDTYYIEPSLAKMQEKPSFNSGLMKDIDKHYFRLLDCSTNDHEFIENSYVEFRTTPTVIAASTVTPISAPVGIGAPSGYNGLETILDRSMDTMKIVVDGSEGTALTLDMVMNVEYVPEAASNSGRFCDETAFAPGAFSKTRNMCRLKYSKA